MDHPDMYRKVGQLKQDISDFVNEFKPLINWRNDGTDSVLDIGCAGGDLTVGVIKSILPKSFSRLVGVDISETMVQYARNNFDTAKVSFDTLDITGDLLKFKERHGVFDHVHSSMTLNLIQDQKAAIQNIYKLLKPNGDCILYILVESLYYEMFRRLNKTKWSEYMKDIDNFISPYSQRHFPEEMLKKHLKNAGFSHYIIKERQPIAICNNIQAFKNDCRPIVKFYVQIPTDKEDEFMEDFGEIIEEISSSKKPFAWNTTRNQQTSNGSVDKSEIFVPHKILVCYARK